MKFKIDENLSTDCAVVLRNAGHDAMTVGEQQMSGSTDLVLASICESEGRAIVTADLDFADLRLGAPTSSHGVVVLRLAQQIASAQVAAVSRLIPLLAMKPLHGRIWIVNDHRVRMRALPTTQ